ncbi:AAA family ATPase [Xanthobacter autotrophicus]|uniref:ATP-dependent DNA helicase n=1 Tax=Xanthobacter autotrophicus TaxID=280 RepID=UPI00372C6238
MSWSPQQERALKAVAVWLKDPHAPQVFYLAGFAGTGKTTLAKEMASSVSGLVLFGAFTGKAALVLQNKGCIGASTIHSMIYQPRRRKGGVTEWILDPDGPVKEAALVVIDEVSMVGRDLGEDLLSYGKKVLVLGDPAQLPPVNGEGYFTARRPDVMLTEVHRQAQDNPIIRMSMDVREGRGLAFGQYGSSKVIPTSRVDRDEVLASDQVLVGINKSRRLYNDRIRSLRGFKGTAPMVGERLVCLRNKRQKGLLNGGLWTVIDLIEVDPDFIKMVVDPADAGAVKQPTEVQVHPYFFTGRDKELSVADLKHSDQFDFGYALTVHKSQGSQWNNVYLFDESGAFRSDHTKWLYTGVTRAAEAVTIARAS